jgi:hypothetical protein
VDGEQKDQLHGITFTGLVPGAGMHTSTAQPYADFSNDPFGNPAFNTYTISPGNVVNVPVITNPYLVTNPTTLNPNNPNRQPGCRRSLRQNTSRSG